jgi:hypothetical protein
MGGGHLSICIFYLPSDILECYAVLHLEPTIEVDREFNFNTYQSNVTFLTESYEFPKIPGMRGIILKYNQYK